MEYDKNYIQTRDIDWFFRFGDKPIHVASAGGKLPDTINDRETLRRNQYAVSKLPYINTDTEITINRDMITKICSNADCSEEDYYSSFFDMAKKGFISIDKTNIEDPDDTKYHVVCMPKNMYSGEQVKLITRLIDGDNHTIKMEPFNLLSMFE